MVAKNARRGASSYARGMAGRLGQYPAPIWRIAHLSDTHLLAGDAPLGGVADTVGTLEAALGQLERIGASFDAVVITGDLADRAEPAAYRRLREIVEPVAQRLGARLCWVAGNHDERVAERVGLLDEEPAATPLCRAWRLGDLRIIALDTSVPGFHHGELDAEQLDWLASELAAPAAAGTILAMHHAPIPTPLALMDVLELRNQAAFAEVIRGTDVRLILGGHLHYPASSIFAGIPVSVAGAVSYTLDVSAPHRDLIGVNGGQSFSIVDVYEDRVVTSVAAIGSFETVTHIPDAFLTAIEALDEEGRIATFSRFADAPAEPE